MSRSSGRYNLHRLGWSAFEDFCLQTLRVVLGETATRFVEGTDGGRDGWFRGTPVGKLLTECNFTGDFVVQCKHSSKADSPLGLEDLKEERKKVQALAAKGDLNYVLLTNRRLTARSELKIRETFEAIPGVRGCLVRGEAWLEDTVDAHTRLLRLVPRLYGIGDLSQILSSTIENQTRAVIEDLADSLRTFVPTDSYRRSEKALHEHGFVVLVGPPASGKTAIAANLCMSAMALDSEARVMRIERAEQFKSTWSPADKKTLYWVDDVFGETTLDAPRLAEWSAAIEKVESARRRGARIIFCTRDYILKDAERHLKHSRAVVLNDARVRVDVTNLTDEERDGILYNHIKDGDLPRERKTLLKPFLSRAARLGSFSPELARRLGSGRFSGFAVRRWEDVEGFFANPVQHFRETIRGLSKAESAALAVCLFNDNAVPDPVPASAIPTAVLDSYGVEVSQIRDALELLEGSLVKRERIASEQTWQLHHPSMVEALQQELVGWSSKLLLYLQSAQIGAVLRDTTTAPPKEHERRVFVPREAYAHLVERLREELPEARWGISEYLTRHASNEFLQAVDRLGPSVLDTCLSIIPDPNDESAARLAVRMAAVQPHSLLSPARLATLENALLQGDLDSGWVGFLEVKELKGLLPGLWARTTRTPDATRAKRMEEWARGDLSDRDLVESAIETLKSHRDLVERHVPFDLQTRRAYEYALERLEEKQAEMAEEAAARSEANMDDWKERRWEEKYELENGPFADVDE